MSKALKGSILSFVKMVLYTVAVAVLAGFDSATPRQLLAVAGVSAAKAILTYVTINCKED